MDKQVPNQLVWEKGLWQIDFGHHNFVFYGIEVRHGEENMDPKVSRFTGNFRFLKLFLLLKTKIQ